MSHSPLALAADNSQLTAGAAGLSRASSSPDTEPDVRVAQSQHPTASSPTNAELAVILRPYLLG